MGKFGPKNQNCQLKLKFATQDSFRYGEFNGDVHLVFSKVLFPSKFGPKIQNLFA